jgi:hypothetical protein
MVKYWRDVTQLIVQYNLTYARLSGALRNGYKHYDQADSFRFSDNKNEHDKTKTNMSVEKLSDL